MWLNQFNLKTAAMVITFVLLAASLMTWLIGRNPASLVVVDMTRAIQKPSVMLAHSKLSSNAQLKIMAGYSALLPKVISEYGQSHRVTIVSATVLASQNKVDVTDEVVALTIERMKHEI